MTVWQTLLTVFLAIGGWIVGFWTSSRQIKRSFELSAKMDRERMSRELSFKATEEIIQVLRNMADEFNDFDQWFRSSILSLRLESSKSEIPLQTFVDFQKEFLERWRKTSNSGIALSFAFESRQVILHPFLEVKKELAATNLRFIKGIDNVTSPFCPRTEEAWDKLQAESAKFTEICWDVIAYARDFQSELQNLVHAPLFGYEIPPRVPTDPKYKVLRAGTAQIPRPKADS